MMGFLNVNHGSECHHYKIGEYYLLASYIKSLSVNLVEMIMSMVTKIRIVAIGRVKEKYLLEAIGEYTKRLVPFCKLELVELKDKGLEKEAKLLERYLGAGTFILDVGGKHFSSVEFAQFVKKQEGTLTFIIGGAEGINESLKKRAPSISLSKMTFTHEMCRLFLVEQIYRTYMINSNRKYHR